MNTATARKYEHVGETKAIEDHDYDLVKFLSNRLEFLWRCDQYIANAADDKELQDFWKEVKKADASFAGEARELICKHAANHDF